MVAVLQDGFGVVSHDDFTGFAADDGGDVAVARPFNAADTAADNGGSIFIAVYHHFNGFGCTAAQRMDGNDVAAADVGENGADGNQVGETTISILLPSSKST